MITTITNVADEREYYAFHDTPAWTGTSSGACGRSRRSTARPQTSSRPCRTARGAPTYTWTNTSNPLDSPATDVHPVAAVSDRVSAPGRAGVHSLDAGVLFAGNGPTNDGLHRVYGFSDSDCVNVVYRGAVVGGPAYAPRTSGPLESPADA